jgi:tetratricopeptide (TPR) repeat protein
MKVLFTLLFCFMPFSMIMAAANSEIGIQLERVGDMTHFEFNGKKEWVYDLKKTDNKISITLGKMTSEATEALEGFESLLVNKITVDNTVDNKTKIEIELSDKRIESFDYLTQDPPHFIVDLFVGDDSLLNELNKKNIAKQELKNKNEELALKETKPKKNVNSNKKNPDRKPAFAEFLTTNYDEPAVAQNSEPFSLNPQGPIEELFDFGSLTTETFDSNSLEAKVVEADGNIYLRFPMLKLKNKYLQELQSFRPEYEIKKSYSDENKQARLLLQLFNQKSFASFIKAKKTFKATFPESTYDEILSYVEADTWIELWKLNKRPEYLSKATNIYKMLIERYPHSKIAERTLIQAGLMSHDVGEYFIATKMLRRYLKNYPESPFNNHIKIYLADSLAFLKNYDDARNVLDQIIDSDEEGSSVEAEYRLGDIYFLKQSFRRAEGAYMEALKKHPRQKDKFPNAIFNMAEAQFNLAEYPTSLKSFEQFYKEFPTHPYGGYALTRIGELIDILYKDKKRAQGFYNESFYRYRNTTGGTLARMRSLSQRFKDMKKQELETSIEEIKNREKIIDLNQVDEFAAFMISDGFYNRGDFLEAANTLINYFQTNPKPVNIKKFEKRISRAIAGDVKENIRKGDLVKALNTIESHQKSWLSKSKRVDVQFFRAHAYEMMGLVDEAINSYEIIIKRMKTIAGTKEETERRVFEYYPSFDQVYLRQAVAEYKNKNSKKSLELLKKVKQVKALDDVSKTDYYYTLSQLSYDTGKFDDALKMAEIVDVKAIHSPEKKEKFNVYLSEVYEKNKMFDKALSILEKFYEEFKGAQDQVYVLSRLFHLYRDKGMIDKAISTGDKLLSEYANKYNLDKERYYLGELYFNQNDSKQAQKIWKDLTKKSMWSELAQNKAVTDQWKQETKESINRIPAMAK